MRERDSEKEREDLREREKERESLLEGETEGIKKGEEMVRLSQWKRLGEEERRKKKGKSSLKIN